MSCNIRFCQPQAAPVFILHLSLMKLSYNACICTTYVTQLVLVHNVYSCNSVIHVVLCHEWALHVGLLSHVHLVSARAEAINGWTVNAKKLKMSEKHANF